MITPANWQPFIIQADTSVREAWSAAPVEYAEYTTEKTLGKASQWIDGWIGRMPTPRLWSGPRLIREANPQTFTATPEPFELSYGLDKFRYDDDGYGVFYPLLEDWALQTKRFPALQIRDLLEASGAWSSTTVQQGMDGLSFFNTAHKTNIYSTATASLATGTTYCNDFTGSGQSINGATVGGTFSVTSVLTIVEYMATIRAEDGERMGVTPSHIMHPATLRGEAEYVVNNGLAAASVGFTTWGAAQTQVGATDNVVKRMGLRLIENKYLASSTKFYTMDCTKSVRPLRAIFREPFAIVPLINPTDPNVFALHYFVWGGECRFCPTWSPSFLMNRSGP